MKSSLRSGKKEKPKNSKIPSPSVSCSAVLFSTFVVSDVTCPQYHISSHSPLPKSFYSSSSSSSLSSLANISFDSHFYSFEFVLYEFMFKCFSTSHFLSVFLTWLTKGKISERSWVKTYSYVKTNQTKLWMNE